MALRPHHIAKKAKLLANRYFRLDKADREAALKVLHKQDRAAYRLTLIELQVLDERQEDAEME